MKRLILGLAVAAAATFAAAPASADDGLQWCGFTPPVPCGYCVGQECVWF